MKSIRSWFSVLLVAGLLGSILIPASTVQARSVFAHGTVVALQGTPHLWFADAQGILHWGGDTRALAGRPINWNNRVEVSSEQLRTLSRGAPWLSAGLLKDGDPIYLAKWETDWPEPRLFHIQSIGDVELFGINSTNYGAFVMGKPAWESHFGFSVADLQLSTLAATTTPPPPPEPRSHPASPDSKAAVPSRPSSAGDHNDDDDDDDDDDTDTDTATATATATATDGQTATATATATDDGTSVTNTATDDTDDDDTDTATDTATATATGDTDDTDTDTDTDTDDDSDSD